MRFYDEITITVQSGKGWDGTVAWRREAGVPFWGPSGWNWGKGWSIVLQASKDENTLQAYRYKSKFKAKPGEPGRSKDQYWANADDLFLTVPVWTIVRDKETDEILYAFMEDKEQWTIVYGGEWWVGNMHFKDAIHQYPHFCLLGEPGNKKEVVLELQLLADIALIGTPSVGKTSLINTISNTKAKVADYPFTTLVPNLGSVTFHDTHFNVIDIPGLIKGAAEGKWLGNAFLRHILKAKVFCLMSDISRYDEWIREIPELLEEIHEYANNKLWGEDKQVEIKIQEKNECIMFYVYEEGELIVEKKMVFVINKYDLINDWEILKEYKEQLRKQIQWFFKKNKTWTTITKELLDKHTFTLSAATHFGVDEWLNVMVDGIKNIDANEVYHIENIPHKTIQKTQDSIKNINKIEKKFLIEKEYITENDAQYINIREIYNEEFAKFVRQLPRGNDEAEWWFRKQMGKKWFLDEFENAGIQKWDIFKVISPYKWLEPRYIQY